ncbi:uncharacterized protein C13G5.2-like [Cloeon dipterum]|uniref:uncharacterized protein C13G5.2-like n=1 Tax=Cloeon dipterum TaxID=197152 RepID=UPI00322001C1
MRKFFNASGILLMLALLVQVDGKANADAFDSYFGAAMAPANYVLLKGKDLSKSTVAGIKDVLSGEWLFRLDRPHKGCDFHHLNINSKQTGLQDPHIYVPKELVEGAAVLNYIPNAVNLYGGARLAYAAYQDVQNGKVEETAKFVTTAAKGFVRAGVCSNVGSAVGGMVGFLFGGVGAVAGTLVGNGLCLWYE